MKYTLEEMKLIRSFMFNYLQYIKDLGNENDVKFLLEHISVMDKFINDNSNKFNYN